MKHRAHSSGKPVTADSFLRYLGIVDIPGFRPVIYHSRSMSWPPPTSEVAMASDDLSPDDEEALVADPRTGIAAVVGSGTFVLAGAAIGAAVALAALPVPSFGDGLLFGVLLFLSSCVVGALAGVGVGAWLGARQRRADSARRRSHWDALDRADPFLVPLGVPEAGPVNLQDPPWGYRVVVQALQGYRDEAARVAEWPDLAESLPDLPAMVSEALSLALPSVEWGRQARDASELSQIEGILAEAGGALDDPALHPLLQRKRRLEQRMQRRGDEVEEAAERVRAGRAQVRRLDAIARARSHLAVTSLSEPDVAG